MNLKTRFWCNLFLVLLYRTIVIKATLFVFLIEDSAIFQDCNNEPDYLGVADFLDMSNLKVELLDETVHLEGSCTVVWDVDPNDRIELNIDILKYERGRWQPTVFTMIQKDFCTSMFEESDIWYQTWTKYVNADDLKCINNKGHTYHHEPFNLETVFDIQGKDISGPYKVVIKADAYNEQDEKQPNSVCLEVKGDIIRK